MLIVEDPTVTVKCRAAIKALFSCFKLCVGVMFDTTHFLFTTTFTLFNIVLTLGV